MAINDPFFDNINNLTFDHDEVTFDDLGLGLGLGRAGRPPVIPTWVPWYGYVYGRKKMQ